MHVLCFHIFFDVLNYLQNFVEVSRIYDIFLPSFYLYHFLSLLSTRTRLCVCMCVYHRDKNLTVRHSRKFNDSKPFLLCVFVCVYTV
jgi:hypothetical protein